MDIEFNFEGAIIMGSIYDPELDRRIVLLSVDPRDWENYERNLEELEYGYGKRNIGNQGKPKADSKGDPGTKRKLEKI